MTKRHIDSGEPPSSAPKGGRSTASSVWLVVGDHLEHRRLGRWVGRDLVDGIDDAPTAVTEHLNAASSTLAATGSATCRAA